MRKLGVLLISALMAAGCAQSATISGPSSPAPTSQGEQPGMTGEEDLRAEDEETSWSVQASPSSIELCKVPDGRPSNLQGYPRGAEVGGQVVSGTTGFPFTEGIFPIKGEAKIIAAMVSFEDTNEFVENPVEFLGPQTEKITEWSRFWSQGQFEYQWEIVDSWVRIPMNSYDTRDKNEYLAELILENFPESVDFEGVDGTFIYWAPGLQDSLYSGHDFAIRVGSNENPFVIGEKRPGLLWAPSKWHYEDSGTLKYETKRDYTWSYWIHELLHEQGLNLHAPGNGWATGLGQNQYPLPARNGRDGKFSAAISAWEMFLMGWLKDDQVHCVTSKDIAEGLTVGLTPLEIEGGDRKALVVNLEGQDTALVVESRRPVGYTEWDEDESGVLVYSIDPEIINQDDHSAGDCGNDPRYPKWAYYLFRDSVNMDPASHCNGADLQFALMGEGRSVTFGGALITLEESGPNLDLLSVRAAPAEVNDAQSKKEELSAKRSELGVFEQAQVVPRKPEEFAACSCCGCFAGNNLH